MKEALLEIFPRMDVPIRHPIQERNDRLLSLSRNNRRKKIEGIFLQYTGTMRQKRTETIAN